MADIVTDISRNKNWNARKGVNNPFTITFTSGGSAFNISGYTFSLQVRNFGSSTNLVSLTQGSGLTNNGAAGTLVGTISSANLTSLSPNDYYWQLTVVQPDTYTYVLLQGRFSLFEETYTGDATSSVTVNVSLTGSNVALAITLANPSSGIGGTVTANFIPYANASGTLANTTMEYIDSESDQLIINVNSLPFIQSVDTPTDPSKSLFIGQDAGKVFLATNTGYANTMIGFESGKAAGGASSNTFLGYQSGLANTTGSLNTFIGTVSGSTNTTGSQNTFIGYHSGYLATGSSKTALGYEALSRCTHASIGTAIGWHALYLATSGINSAFGHEAGGNVSTGTRNTIVGNEAGVVLTTANDNTFVGHRSGYAGAIGNDNTFVGAWTGQLSTGTGNVYIGKDAGQIITSGDNNIFIGANSAETKTSGSDNIVIGKGITTSTLSASNEMNIGGVFKTTGLYGTPVNTITGQTTFESHVIISGTRVSMANLPTSSSGLATGDLWNNSGVVNIA